MPATSHLSKSRFLDVLAAGLSSVCVLHCLALPLMLAALPFLGVFSENHLVHQSLVVLAAPVSVLALIRSGGWRHPLLAGLAVVGLGLLATGAFYAPAEAYETLLSVAGACLLAALHLINLRWPHRH